MPVIRYRTGDAIEMISENKFLLKGRLSDQFNIWSCKVNISEIALALEKLKIPYQEFQIDFSLFHLLGP